MDPKEACVKILDEAGDETLHWTVVLDRALTQRLIDPFTTPDVRGVVVKSLAALAGLGVLLSRLAGSKGSELRQGLKRQTDKASGGWDRAPEPSSATDPASSAEVTQLHGNGAGSDPARTPPS